jgi:hypothetical protein
LLMFHNKKFVSWFATSTFILFKSSLIINSTSPGAW